MSERSSFEPFERWLPARNGESFRGKIHPPLEKHDQRKRSSLAIIIDRCPIRTSIVEGTTNLKESVPSYRRKSFSRERNFYLPFAPVRETRISRERDRGKYFPRVSYTGCEHARTIDEIPTNFQVVTTVATRTARGTPLACTMERNRTQRHAERMHGPGIIWLAPLEACVFIRRRVGAAQFH